MDMRVSRPAYTKVKELLDAKATVSLSKDMSALNQGALFVPRNSGRPSAEMAVGGGNVSCSLRLPGEGAGMWGESTGSYAPRVTLLSAKLRGFQLVK